MIRRNQKTDRKVRESKKVIVAMSPKESLRLPTGQAGGFGRKKKVVVAMSGGVDSSVAVALLKRAGPAPEQARYGVNFDVVGVFMKFWSEPRSGSTRINADSNADLRRYENRCCSSEAEARARKVAKVLKIPFYVFNFEKEFKKRIVDVFLEGYKKGITPNPCVVCNKEIKFGLLLEKALQLGADYVATGHYARKIQNPKSKNQKLLVAKDKEKDQSYFLWQLNQNQLKRILFPIGDYTRKEVEDLARKFKLPVLKAKKSVEICFIQTTINDFLKRYFKPNPGKIICLTSDAKHEVVGEHHGLWFYTIGQRKGIKLPGGPYYVLSKDLKKNTLIVTKNEKDLYKKELIVKKINWIRAPSQYDKRSVLDRAQKVCALVSGKEPRLRSDFVGISGWQAKFPLKVKAKIRYRHNPAPAIIYKLQTKNYNLIFTKPQRAITPGQSVVFYLPTEALAKAGRREELLGGGIIS